MEGFKPEVRFEAVMDVKDHGFTVLLGIQDKANMLKKHTKKVCIHNYLSGQDILHYSKDPPTPAPVFFFFFFLLILISLFDDLLS